VRSVFKRKNLVTIPFYKFKFKAMKLLKRLVFVSILSLLLSFNLTAQVTFTNYQTQDGLPHNYISGGVAIDINNNVWIGTQAGLAKFDGTNWTSFDVEDGLIENYINCVATDIAGNVWVGTATGVSKFNGVNFVNYTTTEGLADNTINHIAAGLDGNVWLATNVGLSKFNGTDFTNYGTADGFPEDLISYIRVDASGNVWLGTWSSGVVLFDGTDFSIVISTSNGLPENYICSIAIDGFGNKWICTYSGISVFDASNVWTVNYTIADGLLTNLAKDITVDSDGNVWACLYNEYVSDGGIAIFNGTTWTNYLPADGLVDVLVKRVRIDNLGKAWVTTGNGVSKMELDAGIGHNSVFFNAEIYPNPTNDVVFVKNLDENSSYKIFDLGGKDLTSLTTISNNCISIASLANGVYTIRTEKDGKFELAKIIKK
jgi:ligand-binding sensor domain-containing protein